MRKTKALLHVAEALMQKPAAQHWGYELGREADIRSGVMYPILRRLLDEGWLEDGWEDPATTQGRPPRRYYTLTELGIRELGGLVVHAQGRAPTRSHLREGFAR
jgi:PadR family transcriptional regulator PadR